MMKIAEALDVEYEQAFVLPDGTKISMGNYIIKKEKIDDKKER